MLLQELARQDLVLSGYELQTASPRFALNVALKISDFDGHIVYSVFDLV